jgi:exopolysaccharide biosynthesis polyprenyl glycosylphosphotransferase
MCADLLAAGLALLVCMSVLADDMPAAASLALLPVVVLASKLSGLYDRDELLLHKSTLDEAPAIFQLATLLALLVWLLQDFLVIGELHQAQVLGFWLSLFAFSIVGRALARWHANRNAPPERCLLVGNEEARRRLFKKLTSERRGDARLVCHVPLADMRDGPNGNGRFARAWAPEELDKELLNKLVADHDIHRVIMAPPWSGDSDKMLDVISSMKALGVKVSILPRMFEVIGSSVEFDDCEGITMLGVRRFGLSRSSALVKRSVDVTGSLLAMIALAPVWAVIALAIRLETPGPVLFRQMRVGRDGKRFEMLKFRSMVRDADQLKAELKALNESQGLFKIAQDPRVTRVGRLLRKTSLDETPQLWNVLKGEMSLIGPRPLVVEDDQRVEGWHRRRLHLTPGMTGRWQVLGAARVPLQEMVVIDYLYVANWSLWNDVKILLRTAAHVVRGNGV